jgi:hypothetical protein
MHVNRRCRELSKYRDDILLVNRVEVGYEQEAARGIVNRCQVMAMTDSG